jgi:threonine/homoserine/homoserine lactone efflux protein
MPLPTLLSCLAAVTALTLAPGLDTVLVIRNSGRGGARDGTATSLGICLGLFVHATLSALGLSVLLLHTAWAWNLLKFAGAGWLIFLGISSLRDARKSGTASFTSNKSEEFSLKKSLREGLFCNTLNPKAIIFYLAFLPQFIDPEGSILLQSLLVAFLHFCVAMLYLVTISFTVERARSFLARERVNKAFHALSGAVLLFFGVQLLMKD